MRVAPSLAEPINSGALVLIPRSGKTDRSSFAHEGASKPLSGKLLGNPVGEFRLAFGRIRGIEKGTKSPSWPRTSVDDQFETLCRIRARSPDILINDLIKKAPGACMNGSGEKLIRAS
jgi:hypothetical protein